MLRPESSQQASIRLKNLDNGGFRNGIEADKLWVNCKDTRPARKKLDKFLKRIFIKFVAPFIEQVYEWFSNTISLGHLYFKDQQTPFHLAPLKGFIMTFIFSTWRYH